MPEPPTHRLVTDGTLLRDGLGRIVYLRGINAGTRSKFAPYVPFDFEADGYDEALGRYLDRASAWGFSALRVPFSWAAVEPSKGMDDEVFLARYDALLEAAWERRMWTIIDFHQDIYSEVYCGDGFPEWTVPDPHPAPHHDCPNWFLKYTQDDDVKAAFDRFWSDSTGVRTAFGALWDRMAARHANRPGVIGFEIINEPSAGTANEKVWAETTLTDFYSEMAARIHEKAPDALVFFDATGTDGVGATTSIKKPAGEGLVFAPHWYDSGALFGGIASPKNGAASLARWAAKGAEWGIPVLIGESGARRDMETANEFFPAIYDAMDANGLHFTYWEYSDSKESWNAEDLSVIDYAGGEATAILDGIVRPFPRAVAGEAPAFHYDAAERAFSLSYTAKAEGVTEISVPARAYPSGYRVEVTQGCVDASREGVLLVEAGAGANEIKIFPR